MRTVSYRLGDLARATINIGKVAENEYTRVQFNAEQIFAEYPAATAALSVINPAGTAYPAVVTREGNLIIWDVTDADLTAEGMGELQLTLTENGVVIKSYIARTRIERSIVASGSTPDPVQNWLDNAAEVLEEVQDAIPAGGTQGQVMGKLSDDDYDIGWIDQTGGGGGGGTSNYNDLSNKPQIAGTTLSGNKTLAQLGIAAASDIPDVSGFYTKPAGGIPAADIASGVIPDPTDIIDDTAGDGDTDKVWSADKTAEEVSTLSSAITELEGEVEGISSDIGGYVSDWLDEHPEATTTVQDGSITKAKLQDWIAKAVDGVNPAIEYFGTVGKTAKQYNSKNISHPRKVTFYGNTYAFRNCRIANKANLHKNDNSTTESNGIKLVKNANGFNAVDGATTLTYNPTMNVGFGEESIPAGTYRIFVDINKGNSTITGNMSFKYGYKYTGDNSYTYQSISLSETGYVDVTFTSTVIATNPQIVINKSYSYDGFVVWFGLYPADVTIIDTEHTVSNGSTYDYTYSYSYPFETIDTMQHESVVEYIVPENKKNAIVTPEMFGAVGNGIKDDTVAVQSCIDYAIANKMMVVGKNEYRLTSKITISTNAQFFYFNQLYSYDYDGYLVELNGIGNALYIMYLRNTYGKGLYVSSYYGVETIYNYINIRRTLTKNECIYLNGDDTQGTPPYISYNTFVLGNIKSNNGNCIQCGSYDSENYVYGAKFRCVNGWAIYKCHGIKCYGASFEGDVYGGIYLDYNGSGQFYGCRHVELTDKLAKRISGSSETGGTLVKFVGAGQWFSYNGTTRVPYQAIDTTEMTDCTDPNADVDPPETWSPSHRRFHWSINKSYINCPIDYAHFNNQNGGFLIGDCMMVFAGKKVCKPAMNSAYTVTSADYDMRDTSSDIDQTHNLIYATRFIIDAAECVIHLASSYCCQGYNEFIVEQNDGSKLCTIYNSYDDTNPIFDGESLGVGVYKLKCECDFSATTDKLPQDWAYTTTFYTGYNDKWTVERIS